MLLYCGYGSSVARILFGAAPSKNKQDIDEGNKTYIRADQSPRVNAKLLKDVFSVRSVLGADIFAHTFDRRTQHRVYKYSRIEQNKIRTIFNLNRNCR